MTLTVHTARAHTPWGAGTFFPDEAQKETAPRRDVAYVCAREDCPFSPLSVPFAAEAEAPATWNCRCGATARLEGAPDGTAVPPKLPGLRSGSGRYDRIRDGKSSRVYLAERRSDAELEDILAERLAAIRGVTP